jgi:nitrogen-specific signal transduction histidine kinase
MEHNNFYATLLENDLNPFILFDQNGKIKDFNKEAEFLFNLVKPKELYELAISYASLSFGFNRKFISLKYGKSLYYAILVGYINDDEIGLRLYKEVSSKDENLKIEDIELVNIFSLVELSKSTTLLQYDILIDEIYDVSIPEIKTNINQFLLTLNECFNLFKTQKQLQLKIYIKIGEYEIIQNKKYQVIAIDFKYEYDIKVELELINNALKAHINVFVEDKILRLEFPMILSS